MCVCVYRERERDIYIYINTYIKYHKIITVTMCTSLSSTTHGYPIHQTRFPNFRLRFLGLFGLSGGLRPRSAPGKIEKYVITKLTIFSLSYCWEYYIYKYIYIYYLIYPEISR